MVFKMETKTKKQMDKTTEAVYYVLNKYKNSRDNDTILIFLTLKKLGFSVISKDRKITLDLGEIEKYPSFETITRCRRLLQVQYPDLKSSEKIEQLRCEKRKEIVEYVRNY